MPSFMNAVAAVLSFVVGAGLIYGLTTSITAFMDMMDAELKILCYAAYGIMMIITIVIVPAMMLTQND